MKWFTLLIDRLFVLCGAIAFSQAPLFMQQYTSHLAGHTAELHFQVTALEKTAESSQKTLTEYIKKFSESQDSDFSRQGHFMQNLVDRWQLFHSAYTNLLTASVFSKPLYFIAQMNQEIAIATWNSYEFGLPFTIEGLFYAFIGMLFGYAVFSSLARILWNFTNLFRSKKTNE